VKPEEFFRPIWALSSGIFVRVLIVNTDQS